MCDHPLLPARSDVEESDDEIATWARHESRGPTTEDDLLRDAEQVNQSATRFHAYLRAIVLWPFTR